jgi:hypothetical protein
MARTITSTIWCGAATLSASTTEGEPPDNHNQAQSDPQNIAVPLVRGTVHARHQACCTADGGVI